MDRIVEDDYYVYHEDGIIISKLNNEQVGRVNNNGYVRFYDRNDRKMKRVHRVLYEKFVGPIGENMQVNHINFKKDDNRICNLNLMTHNQNQQWSNKPITNTSGYKNICWHKGNNKWVVNIGDKYYGGFVYIDDAIQKRDEAIKELNELGNNYYT